MAVTLNASTSSGLVQTADTSGKIEIQSNGTTEFTIDSTGAYGQLVRGTANSTTGTTSIDFTGLPSWTKRINVVLQGTSTNAANNVIVQLGTSSGFTTSGYLSSLAVINATTPSTTSATNGFLIASSNAASTLSGIVTLTNITSNSWVYTSVAKTATSVVSYCAGDVSLSGTLTQVRITDTAGTGGFDAGTINILYEG